MMNAETKHYLRNDHWDDSAMIERIKEIINDDTDIIQRVEDTLLEYKMGYPYGVHIDKKHIFIMYSNGSKSQCELILPLIRSYPKQIIDKNIRSNVIRWIKEAILENKYFYTEQKCEKYVKNYLIKYHVTHCFYLSFSGYINNVAITIRKNIIYLMYTHNGISDIVTVDFEKVLRNKGI